MNIEQVIEANTKAILALTEVLKALDGITGSGSKVVAEEPIKEEVVKETTPSDVAYSTVRELVLKLAKTNGPAIKDIYKKVGVSKPSELLTNPDDFNSEVTDQGKLNAIFEALSKLES